jgi:hypothetical protein
MDNTESTTVCPMEATPAQPTSLGDTPPVGNVHAATAAEASVSNPEGSPPERFNSRQLKITETPGRDWLPSLRIQGKWLKEAGFSIGEHVRVSVSWQRLLIEVMPSECVTRLSIREERHLAFKDNIQTCRADFAAAVLSHPKPACGGAMRHGDNHVRPEESCSHVADSADFTPLPPRPPLSKRPGDRNFVRGTWPEKISALLKPALGDLLYEEATRLELTRGCIAELSEMGLSAYAALDRGEKQTDLSKFIAIAWALDQDARELFDKLLKKMGFPDGARPIHERYRNNSDSGVPS